MPREDAFVSEVMGTCAFAEGRFLNSEKSHSTAVLQVGQMFFWRWSGWVCGADTFPTHAPHILGWTYGRILDFWFGGRTGHGHEPALESVSRFDFR